MALGRFLTIRIFGIISLLLLCAPAFAQYPVVTAEQLKAWMDGNRKLVLIDVRLPEEYREAHIPGAINIPAAQMPHEKKRLPRDKSVLMVFYCRGVG